MKRITKKALHVIKNITGEKDKGILKMKLIGFVILACVISAGIFTQSCSRLEDDSELFNIQQTKAPALLSKYLASEDFAQFKENFKMDKSNIDFNNMKEQIFEAINGHVFYLPVITPHCSPLNQKSL
jgi:hypothetical protein